MIATVQIRGSVEQIRAVLLDAARLPDWNPAFLSLGPAAPDGSYPIRVRGGLRGRFRYTLTEKLRLESAWHVPGLAETNYWELSPTGDGTTVEHGFVHTGPVGAVMRGAFASAAGLRVDRLKSRVEGRVEGR